MKLSATDIDNRVTKLPGWKYTNESLVRQLTFTSFPDAIAFATRLAFDAQEADHHPDLLISYKRVTVTWSTHDEGGVTEKDFKGAGQTDTVAKVFGAT